MSTNVSNYTAGTHSWSVPATLINGYVTATVLGSPGQGAGGGTTTTGYGAKISGNIPVVAGTDSMDLYVADGNGTWSGTNGYHQGGTGGAGYGTGHAGGHGGASSAVVRHSDSVTMIEAAGGGGMGGFQDSTDAPYIAGNGGPAGNGTGVAGADGSNGGSLGLGGTPISGGTAATSSGPGAGGVPPAGGTGFGSAGAPTGSGNGGAAGATGDSSNSGGGGGGGGGVFGGGGGAGGMDQGGGGGGGAGLGVVDPSVFGVQYAGYSYSAGQISLVWKQADAPAAPVLVSPANGSYADLAAGPTFEFQYVPNTDSGILNQWAFKDSTSSMYWNAAGAAWSATIVWNDVGYLTGGVANYWSYTFPAGAFSNGAAMAWTVACTESHYNLGTSSPTFAATSSVTGAASPVVTVTAPTWMSNVTTVTPAVTWTETLAAGPQASYRVLVYTEAQASAFSFTPGTTAAFYDTGVVSGTALTATMGALPPSTYQAFVQVVDAHGEANQWGSTGSWTEFTVRLQTLTAPTFTATAGTDPSNGAPAAVLTVTPSAGPTAVSVEYSDDGGTTWNPVPGAWMVPWSSGSVTLYDYTIPLGAARQYQAEANGTTTSGGVTYPAVSPWAGPHTVTVTATRWWLSDPLNGASGGSIGLQRVSSPVGADTSTSPGVQATTSIEIDQTEQQSTFRPFGRSIPVTVRGDLYAEEFDISLLFQGAAAWNAFVALRDRRTTLVMRSDMGDVFYGILGPDLPGVLIRAADRTSNPTRTTTVHFTPADPPTVT